MNPKLLRRLLASVVAVGAFAGLYYYTHAPLLRIRLQDGTEIRVLKVAYGTGANHEHELVRQSELKLRLIHLLPQRWQNYFNPPIRQGLLSPNATTAWWRGPVPAVFRFHEPMLSVWWVYDPPPMLPDPDRVIPKGLVTVSSGEADFLQYRLIHGEADMLAFHLPPKPPTTFPVHLVLNGQSVDFVVPVPPRTEPTASRPTPGTTFAAPAKMNPIPTSPGATPFVNHFGRASRLQDASEEGK